MFKRLKTRTQNMSIFKDLTQPTALSKTPGPASSATASTRTSPESGTKTSASTKTSANAQGRPSGSDYRRGEKRGCCHDDASD